MTKYLTITIETNKQTYRVMNIQLNPISMPTVCNDGFRVLTGPPADWLYIALTGHSHNEHPNQANYAYANAARAHITKNAGTNKAWGLTRAVVNQWGLYIRPWLGCYFYDQKTGKLTEDAPEYYILLDLWTGQRISPAATYEVVQR